jgi:Ca2+-transporting ATPase
MVLVLLGVFLYFLPEGVEKARTAAFAVISISQLFNMFTMRSLHQSVFEIGLFSNKIVNIVFCISLTLMLIVMYIPKLQQTFGFVSLTQYELSGIAVISLLVFVAAEVVKKIRPAGSTYIATAAE